MAVVALALVALLALAGVARAENCLVTARNLTDTIAFFQVVDAYKNGDDTALQTLANAFENILATQNGTFFLPQDANVGSLAVVLLLHASLQGTFPLGELVNGKVIYSSDTTNSKQGQAPAGLGVPTTKAPLPLRVFTVGATKYITATGALPSDTDARRQIVQGDIACNNGVIHLINNQFAPARKISEVLSSVPAFSQIATGINGNPTVRDQLNGLEGVTFLVPTDTSITNLLASFGQGAAGYLTDTDEGKQLFNLILQYHFPPTPGYTMLFSQTLLFSGKFNSGLNVSTILGVDPTVPPTGAADSQPLELRVNPTTYVAQATSYARFTSPRTIAPTVGGVQLVDFITDSGVIHGLDGVLIPTNIQLTLEKIALGLGGTTFLQYLQQNATALYDRLTDFNTFSTVFLPTNEAFQTAASAVAGLTAAQLETVLKLHVVTQNLVGTNANKLGAAPAGSYATVATGEQLVVKTPTSTTTQPIEVRSGASKAGVYLIQTSIAQNGYVYSIDTVLLPASLNPGPTPSATPTPTSDAAASRVPALLVAIASVLCALVSALML